MAKHDHVHGKGPYVDMNVLRRAPERTRSIVTAVDILPAPGAQHTAPKRQNSLQRRQIPVGVHQSIVRIHTVQIRLVPNGPEPRVFAAVSVVSGSLPSKDALDVRSLVKPFGCLPQEVMNLLLADRRRHRWVKALQCQISGLRSPFTHVHGEFAQDHRKLEFSMERIDPADKVVERSGVEMHGDVVRFGSLGDEGEELLSVNASVHPARALDLPEANRCWLLQQARRA